MESLSPVLWPEPDYQVQNLPPVSREKIFWPAAGEHETNTVIFSFSSDAAVR